MVNKRNIKIRKATSRDIPTLLLFNREIQDYHHSFDKRYLESKKSENSIKKYLSASLKRKNNYYYILEVDGNPVGFFSVSINKLGFPFVNEKIGHLTTAYVRKEYRKLGLGKLALKTILVLLEKMKIKEIELSVDAKNLTGIKVWESLGFSEFRKRMLKKI